MKIINIILFFVYTYGLGYSLTRFIKQHSLEATVMRIGIGLGAIPVLGVLLNTLHIPIDWRIILAISVVLPTFDLVRNLSKFNPLKKITFKLQKSTILLLLIFAFSVFIYCNGPFRYPWLEDDDPWNHAASIKYITVEKSFNTLSGEFQYLNPYPPGYDIVLSIMHQTMPSIYWTMKFFNGFIIALGILFFYYFVKEFTKNNDKALWATFFLASLPCYLSHFIWAHALIVTLFFPAFYTVLKSQKEKRFLWSAVFIIAGIFMIQPTQSIKFVILLFLLFAATSVIKKHISRRFIVVLILAGAISLLWWAPVMMQMKGGTLKMSLGNEVEDLTVFNKAARFAGKLFGSEFGTATRAYTLRDYIIPPRYNMINNPTGVGPPICILAFAGVFFMIRNFNKNKEEEKIYCTTTLCWLVFTFLGMNSKTFNLPVGLFAFRFWMLFAIPVSLLAAEMVTSMTDHANGPFKRKLTTCIIIISVFTTTIPFKYSVNTSVWPWGIMWASETDDSEITGYEFLKKTLKANTKVFAFTDNMFVIGYDMHSDFWSEKYKRTFEGAINFELPKLHAALKESNYEHIIIGGREIKKFGADVIRERIGLLKGSDLFHLTHSVKDAVWIFEVL